jgi:hypothetical protein
MKREAEIQAEILLALGSRPDIRLWRSNAGMAVPLGGSRPVRYGVNGQADISGIMRVGGVGVRLEVEVKAAAGRQSEDQRRFQAMIEAMGGIYILARSASEALLAVEEILEHDHGDEPRDE